MSESDHEHPARHNCLSHERLDALAANAASTDFEHAHLAACSLCQQALDAARRDAALMNELGLVVRGRNREPHSPSSSREAGNLPAGTIVGGFTIVGTLGVGGMGVVYRAMQASPVREVALKLLKTSTVLQSHQQRFEHESAALAMLQHPGIAQVYQAGTAEVRDSGGGSPGGREAVGGGSLIAYMAMELVHGRPLSQYCAQQCPSLPARILLIARIAEAVDHAHRRGVIHRDLKPANVLVSADGQPKILDFGVAKLTEGRRGVWGQVELTMAGSFVGTLAYASPEQVSGDPSAIDARTDVFSLGVMLYEVVCGERPFNLGESLADAVRAIKAAQVPEVARSGFAPDRELLTVMRKALAPEPDRRYQSAAALAEDLHRYLEKRPLRARPDSAWYTFQRTLARHPGKATAAALALCAVMVAGGAMLALQFKVSRAEKAKSNVLDAVLGALERTNQDELNTPRITSIDEFLADAGETIETDLAAFPREQALLRERLGRANLSHQRLDDAERMLDQALEFRRSQARSEPLAYADALIDSGRVKYRSGKFDAACDRFSEARTIRARQHGHQHPSTISATYWMGASLLGWKQYERAEMEFTAAAQAQQQLDPMSPQAAEYLNGLAACVRARGDFERALAIARQALSSIETSAGEDSKPVAVAISNVASNLISLKRYEEAEPLLDRALAIRSHWYGDDDPRLADTLVLVTGLKMRMGAWGETEAARARLDEAAHTSERALSLRRRVHSGDHESVAEALSLAGQVAMRRAVFDDALDMLKHAMDMRARLPRHSDADLGRSESIYGDCLLRAGHRAEAEHYLRSGLAKVQAAYGNDHRHTLDAQERLDRFNSTP